MKTSELKARRAEINTRQLEITSELAEIKRKWIVSGEQTPLEVRVTLEAESARLAMEKHTITSTLGVTEKARRMYYAAAVHAELVRLVAEAGRSDLLISATQCAIDQMDHLLLPED